MRFIHTSDLHIGKVVNGFSMLEEQEHVLKQITALAIEKQADAVFLCGDLYDRSVPPASAVTLLDDFLTGLVDAGIHVFVIAGNHDSGERLDFGSRILEHRALYVEGSLKGAVRFVDFKDEWGIVRIHMLPFARPSQLRAVYGAEVVDYESGMREILNHVDYLDSGRNILLAHQFVVNKGVVPELSESETRVTVGGADQVESENFNRFVYTALGHIHGGQQIGQGAVYYSGSPVKYSFSEVHHEISVIVGTLDADGSVSVEREKLTPIHDMRKIKGKLSDLILDEVVETADASDYILAVLTNEEELMDPIGTLRSVYPNVMQIQLERKKQEAIINGSHARQMKEKSPLELFEDFFFEVMGKELGEEQKLSVKEAAEAAREGMA